MSKKHEQRTRAEILARRSAPSMLAAPKAYAIPMGIPPVPMIHPKANAFIDSMHFTAATRRAMRSKHMPHTGAKQLAKAETLAERARTRLAA